MRRILCWSGIHDWLHRIELNTLHIVAAQCDRCGKMKRIEWKEKK